MLVGPLRHRCVFVSLQPVRACACANAAWGSTVIEHNYRISDEEAFVSPLPALTPGPLAEEKQRIANGERLSWRRVAIQQRGGRCLRHQPAVRVSCSLAPSQPPRPLFPLELVPLDREMSRLSAIQRLQDFSPQNLKWKTRPESFEERGRVKIPPVEKYHRNPRCLLRGLLSQIPLGSF